MAGVNTLVEIFILFLDRRISSTRYHIPLQRIHSHSRNLNKSDKTDGSPKKDKRRSREIHVLPKISEGQESHGHFDNENERPRSVTESSFERRKHHRHHSHHHHERKDHKDKKDRKDLKDLKDSQDDANERPHSLTDTYFEKRQHHHRHHSHHRKDHKKDTKDVVEKKPHHHHRHHRRQLLPPPHQHRTISEREQLQSRLRSGVLTLREIEPIQERLATEKDEASQLAKRDLEEMACRLITIFNFLL